MYQKTNDTIKKIVIHSILGIAAIIMIFPMFWMLLLSFKQSSDSASSFLTLLFSKYTLSNYQEVWLSDDFFIYFINSIVVSVTVTLANLLFCSMTGYVLARKEFIGRRLIMASVLALLIIPSYVVMIPLYRIMVSLDWINSYFALIIPWLVTPFGVFMLKQYIESLPVQIEDAARMDGAGDWYIFFKIVLPLCKPILIVLAIYIFINNWNSFLFPFLFSNSADYRTLPVGLTFYLGKQSVDWVHLMTGASISAAPILLLFLFFQKRIISGLTAGALK